MPRDRRGDFGTYVGIHREARGYTQTRIAFACNTTQSAISDWETGKAIPETQELVRIVARELGIEPEFLIAIWAGDVHDRARKGDAIVTRSYTTTSKGGGGTEDPYPHAVKP